MAKYIDKDALVAEIERRIKTNKECMLGLRNLDYYQGKVDALNDTISFINTLEVKEVQESTAADKGTAEEIIINLKRVEQDYHIDLTREMEWLRNQVKKGE